ncbi:hypothetical protein FHW36_101596 [Chitinophaga polysaccharea]|uniref:Uncharacterized protein n=1 Tax=Chitinophaga polysaccharea TaxID=1293035 RepID=A0A561Q2T2_9BACT|nr:hypothetical protein [Chitinophaga polysaccharea]TWF44675.1 hypothetical protein FHW36_101596 [Chitinophaga polysaccharea]
MSSKTTLERELEVPVAIIAEVANLLCGQEITPEVIEADEKDETITLSVQFTKDQRDTIHQAEDLIDDYYEEGEDDE